jgi:hypothetical protein
VSIIAFNVVNARRIFRLGRLVTLPQTRRLIIAAVQSPTIRHVARRVAHDRAGVMRDLRRPVEVRDLLLRAVRHPAAWELASAGLLLLPGRYLPLGAAATWAARRLLRSREVRSLRIKLKNDDRHPRFIGSYDGRS